MINAVRRVFFALLTAVAAGCVHAGPYDASANRAADWLAQQRNVVDGSWGSNDEVRYLYTSQAVFALAALNRRDAAYYGGLTWLENHAAVNTDFSARRILALHGNGDNVTSDLQYLSLPGNGGWGLATTYLASPLDTALALQALYQAGSYAVAPNALAYLKTTQSTGSIKGWAVGQEAVSDPATTAQVVRSLIAFSASDATLAIPIANGLDALGTMVTTSSPIVHQALAASAMLRNNPASASAATLLNSMMASQGADGSWAGDIYATSVAIEALAAGMGTDLAAQRATVPVPDVNLRAAINLALGRNALDSLNQGELAKLTSLDISNRGITSLTGLEFASNLTYLNARNNSLTSLAPIQGLTKLTTLLTDGNPLPMSPALLMPIIMQLLLD